MILPPQWEKISPLLNHKKSPHSEVNKSLVGCIFGKWYFSPGEVRQWGCFAGVFFGWLVGGDNMEARIYCRLFSSIYYIRYIIVFLWCWCMFALACFLCIDVYAMFVFLMYVCKVLWLLLFFFVLLSWFIKYILLLIYLHRFICRKGCRGCYQVHAVHE